MWRSEERRELKRAVLQRGERLPAVAARLGVPVSTAQRWIRAERSKAAPAVPASKPKPTFMEVVAEAVGSPALVIRVGAAAIEVRSGVDVELLRHVVAALGAGA